MITIAIIIVYNFVLGCMHIIRSNHGLLILHHNSQEGLTTRIGMDASQNKVSLVASTKIPILMGVVYINHTAARLILCISTLTAQVVMLSGRMVFIPLFHQHILVVCAFAFASAAIVTIFHFFYKIHSSRSSQSILEIEIYIFQ